MEQTTEHTRIDFKMVTFSLAGKDYGIDIMKVKEISKASKCTYVPNAAPFVKGVHNLRGDIISVIDLRIFFNLPIIELENSGTENVIILRLEGLVLAVIVDAIGKVIGIASENIQPPHPLFGDINDKYISGIVENEGHQYLILDVERIFGSEEPAETRTQESTVSTTIGAVKEDIDIGFIEETLITFLSFHSSPVNREWIRSRFALWKNQKGNDVQLTNEHDARTFLASFTSPFSGTFWSGEYAEKIASFLLDGQAGNFNVWNPGCGSGHESYSIACMVKSRLPSVHLRIVAQDNDLIRISTAPGLVVDQLSPGSLYDKFLTKGEGKGGKQFKKEIKDAIFFEFHDITHDNSLPKLDLVVLRDTVSYLVPERQNYVFSILDDVMKPGSLLVLGSNEEPLNPEFWDKVENSGVVAYKKK